MSVSEIAYVAYLARQAMVYINGNASLLQRFAQGPVFTLIGVCIGFILHCKSIVRDLHVGLPREKHHTSSDAPYTLEFSLAIFIGEGGSALRIVGIEDAPCSHRRHGLCYAIYSYNIFLPPKHFMEHIRREGMIGIEIKKVARVNGFCSLQPIKSRSGKN